MGTSPTHLSSLLEFLKLVVALKKALAKEVLSERNKWYQSIPGSSWDHVSIPKALVAVWRRSCVDLGAAVELFVGLCVDLKTAFGLLEKSNLEE